MMNDERLAEYLGDEMSPDERAAFEHALREDPALATEARELAQARDLLRAADHPRTAHPEHPGDGYHLPRSPLLRYAAAALLAFAAGYLVRGGHEPATAPAPPSVATHPDASNNMHIVSVPGPITPEAARAYQQAEHLSDFGRALVALSAR